MSASIDSQSALPHSHILSPSPLAITPKAYAEYHYQSLRFFADKTFSPLLYAIVAILSHFRPYSSSFLRYAIQKVYYAIVTLRSHDWLPPLLSYERCHLLPFSFFMLSTQRHVFHYGCAIITVFAAAGLRHCCFIIRDSHFRH
jgi:hypothetical protein